MEQIEQHIANLDRLNQKYQDVNHPEKLDVLKSLSNLAKKHEKAISAPENEPSLCDAITYLMEQLATMTGKDVIRKLIIKCINILAKSDSINLHLLVKKNLASLLATEKQTVGQKLFVLNIYLENVEKGVACLTDLRFECLDAFAQWLSEEQVKMRQSTAPIVVSKHVQNIQLLFKTLINFLQKCFGLKLTNEEQQKCEKNFTSINESISSLLENEQENFNMELAYLASMGQISVKLLEFGNDNLGGLLENSLRKYSSRSVLDLRDLCLFQAILTITKAPQLLQENDGICLFQKILKTILTSSNETNNLSASIAITRAVNFWLTKLTEILNYDESCLSQFSKIDSDFDWFSALILFVWSKFDSNIDVVKNTNLQNYRIILSIAKKIKANQVDSFYTEQVKKCMSTSWQSNSKLSALIILLENGLSASQIYKNHPSIARDLMGSISERSTACLVSDWVADLYSNLFKSHRDESLARGVDLTEWAAIWWPPIENVLDSNDKLKKTYAYEYLLPRMMRQCPEGILECQRVSKSYASKIICAKINRSLGEDNARSSWWQTLSQGIVHFDDQVRLDAFGLVCDNQKSTEIVVSQEFELIRRFLEFNSDSLSPSFRQIVISHLKKLFFRLKESWLFQLRQVNRGVQNEFECVAQAYKSFVDWLFGFLFTSLHLDSTFAKRNQSLSILTTFVEIVGSRCSGSNENVNVFFEFGQVFDRSRLFSLIECLWDTYEINKDMALKLLEKLDSELFHVHKIHARDYFDVSIELLSSRRPIDSITSVYLMVFVQKKFQLRDVCENGEAQSLSLFLVNSCLVELESHLKQADASLLLAALNKPMYGPLSSIRNLLLHSVDEIKNSSFVCEWRQIITRLMDMCFRIAQIVGPIVNSSSPEGIFPKELRSAEPDEQERAVTPQMLLVCCWRTMKEVALFLGDLVRLLPIELESNSYLLTQDQVSRIGDFFVRLLFEARHLGVFEQTYIGFASMCETFWKSKSKMYCEQPTKWLEYILNAIQEEGLRSKLCSTRRGGGLPCFVQAIVNTELADSGRRSLRTSMRVLLNLAEANHEKDDKNFSKVLAMYILSALFKDTRIGESVLEFAERALITAINGFDSVFWNVRNASTLLFSSLVNRIFGVNRSKEDISKKNSMVGSIFFSKFPSLFSFFKQVISDSIDSINTHINAKLYLVALVLGHLFTLSDQIADPEACLHTYVPLLLKSLKSPVMKTRTFVAKAIITIVNLDRYPSLADDVFSMLLSTDEPQDDNKINGLLMLLSRLFDKCDPFKFMPGVSFIDRLRYLTSEKFSHCAVNFTLILSLLIKSGRLMDASSRDVLNQLAISVALKASQSLLDSNLPPGAHDLLAGLGEIFCLLATRPDVEPLREKLAQLIELKPESSIDLMRGIVKFCDHCKDLDEHSVELRRILMDLFRERALKSIFDWKIVNNIHDLKWSCELLAIFLKTKNGTNNNPALFHNDKGLVDFWNKLLDCAQNQTELGLVFRTETRISVLKLITQAFNPVLEIANSSELGLDKLAPILETYLEQNEEAGQLSEFFNLNSRILCAPTKFGPQAIQLWDIFMQLVLDLSKDSCQVACQVIARETDSGETRKTPLAMIKPAVGLFIRAYGDRFRNETIDFLLDQFVLVSECDSNPNTGEEELETVFDKGVDSIHSSEMFYLEELLLALEDLKAENQDSLDKTYEILASRIQNELRFFQIDLEKMKYNDLKMTKIATHLMFLNKFYATTSKKNQSEKDKIDQFFSKKSFKINSVLKSFIQ